jgi:hypothetical protein
VSRALDPVVPEAVARALGAEPIPDDGLTVLVLAERDGWPHLAMISRGEIVVAGERALSLALWPTSSIARALTEHGRATLSLVVDGTSYALRVTARPAGALTTPLAGTLARFEAEVVSASADEAPYATLESGVTFTLHDPEATLARWAEVRAALRAEVPA